MRQHAASLHARLRLNGSAGILWGHEGLQLDPYLWIQDERDPAERGVLHQLEQHAKKLVLPAKAAGHTPWFSLSERRVAESYMRAAEQYPLLPHAEVIKHAKTVQTGWRALRRIHAGRELEPAEREVLEQYIEQAKESKGVLITSNLLLVRRMANRFRRHLENAEGMDMSDLLQGGNIGLEHAVDKFDPTKGFKFSTYANWWIKKGIQYELWMGGHGMRAPRPINEAFTSIYQASTALESDGIEPTPAAIAKKIGKDETHVRQVLAGVTRQRTISLSELLHENDGTEEHVGDLLVAQDVVDPGAYDRLVADISQDIWRILSSQPYNRKDPNKPAIQYQLIQQSYLRGDDPPSAAVLGKGLGIHTEATRRKLRAAEELLRNTPEFVAKYGDLIDID